MKMWEVQSIINAPPPHPETHTLLKRKVLPKSVIRLKHHFDHLQADKNEKGKEANRNLSVDSQKGPVKII